MGGRIDPHALRAKVIFGERNTGRRLDGHRIGRSCSAGLEHAELAQHVAGTEQSEDEFTSLARGARDPDETALDHKHRVGRLTFSSEIRSRREGAALHALIQCGGSARWEASEQWCAQQHREWIDPALHNCGAEGKPIGLDRSGPSFDTDDVAGVERELGGDRARRRIHDRFP